MSSDALFDRIRALGRLTPSETRIAEYLDQTYPLLALETVSSISQKAGVGRATVVRFIMRLGYGSFAGFQQSLRAELLSRLQSPGERYHERKSRLGRLEIDPLRLHCDQIIANLDETTRRIDTRQLQTCAKLLAACRGTIYVMGYRTSFSLAHFFGLQLSYLLDTVRIIDNLGGSLPNTASGASKRDLIFMIFNTRYSRLTLQAANWFCDRGCRLILLTDRESNPASHLAHLQFVAPSEGISIFESRCTTLAVLETIVDLVATHNEDKLNRHLLNVEAAFEAFETFSDWGRQLPRKTMKRKA